MKRHLIIAFALLCAFVAIVPLMTKADPTLVTTGSVDFDSPGETPALALTGQSSCSMALDTTSGSATFVPVGSSDNGATWTPVAAFGTQTLGGTYGGPITPYLTNFKVIVQDVTGTVSVLAACSGAVPFGIAPSPTPTPVATFTPTPTPTPVPTPPTPTPSPTPANCPIAIASLAPLAYFKLDEPSTSPPSPPADSSGHGYNGALKNSTPFIVQQQRPLTALAGVGDYSYQFTTPGYISLPATLPYGAAFSYIALVSPLPNGTWPQYECIMAFHGQCLAITNGYLGWGQTSARPGRIIASQALALSAIPHFVTLVENTSTNPATVKVAIDGGTLTNANLTNVAALGATTSSYIRAYLNNDLTPGYVDDVAIFSYMLTQTQVTQLATPCAAIAAPTASPSPTPVPPGNYQAAVLALGPLGYYRLDESSGATAFDISGNAYNGTLSAPSDTTQGATGLLVSDANTAYTFTANTARINGMTWPNYKNFTAVFLVKASSYAGAQYWLNYYGRAVAVSANHPSFTFINSTSFSDTSDTLVNNTAYWIAVTNQYTGTGNVCFSVNGGTLHCKANVSGWTTSPQNAFINAGYSASEKGFVGTVDEVAVFPGILTQSQLTALALTAGYSP